jgi:ribulose 1,5-bisphosphate synthetase/thiazole synthase
MRYLNLLTQLINNVYESGKWPKYFTEVTMVALKKKPKARKCTDHRRIGLTAHAAKVVASVIRRRRSEKQIEDVHGKISLDLEKEKELEMQLEC